MCCYAYAHVPLRISVGLPLSRENKKLYLCYPTEREPSYPRTIYPDVRTHGRDANNPNSASTPTTNPKTATTLRNHPGKWTLQSLRQAVSGLLSDRINSVGGILGETGSQINSIASDCPLYLSAFVFRAFKLFVSQAMT